MFTHWPRLYEDLRRDTRYALGQLVRSPAFTVLAFLCLGLGIGVNASIFGILDSLLFRPMPVRDADRLVVVTRASSATLPYPFFREYQARARLVRALTTSSPMETDLESDDQNEFVTSEGTPVNYAEVMGVQPILGTWFTREDEPSAVISHAVWQRRFNGDPRVLGRTIRSASQAYTIVGVMPAAFTGVYAPLQTDLWVPLRTRPGAVAQFDDWQSARFMVFCRLADGASARQASAELDAIDRQIVSSERKPSVTFAPVAAEPVRGIPNPNSRKRMATVAALLAIVVGLVLLIACVNVGHLLLVRGALRHREVTLRRALGATRGRVVRQLLTESLILAIGGAACGLLFAIWTNQALEKSLPSLGRLASADGALSIDWRLVTFAAALSLITTVLCGLVPAWRTSRDRGVVDFRGDVSAGSRRLGRPFGLVAQVGMSLILLVAAGTFVRAALRAQSADPGFAVANRLYAYMFVPTPPFTPDTGRRFFSEAAERVKELPGVETAALAYGLPLMRTNRECVALPGAPPIQVTTSTVDSGYFAAMNIGITDGRDFARTEPTSPAMPVIVNASLAATAWPSKPAVGERLSVGCAKPESAVVVGVVRNSAVSALGEPPQPHVYLPFSQRYAGGVTTIVVATRSDPAALVNPVRRTLGDLGQGMRVYTVEPLREHVVRSSELVRRMTSVLSLFGLLALVLAATGLYGVIAYRVALRRREIGVRMALGARKRDIFTHVVGQGLLIAAVGVLIGELLSVVLVRAIGAMVPGVRPGDVPMHLATGAIWLVVAVLACYVPAARAASVDPLLALRDE